MKGDEQATLKEPFGSSRCIWFDEANLVLEVELNNLINIAFR